MTYLHRIIWAVLLLAAAVGLGLLLGWNLANRSRKQHAPVSRPKTILPTEPTTLVVATEAKRAEIHRTFGGYGIVRPASAALRTRSLPYECVILEELVSVGQYVRVGERLLKVRASQKECLAASKARAELEAARELEKLIQSKIELKLATKQDLVLAGLRVKQAQRVVENMQQLGIGKEIDIRTTAAGIVASIGVQQGQLAPAGSALISLTDKLGLIVDIGIEPEDVMALEEHQEVEIVRVHSAGLRRIKGKIRTITQSVDPKTRLVRVLIQPEEASGLMLQEFVEASIRTRSHTCIVVPGTAVLTDRSGHYLFTIRSGKAQRVAVKTGWSGSNGVEILDGSIQAGDRIVTLGNHELKTGARVREAGRGR